jgi:Tol biopolymer transport system component
MNVSPADRSVIDDLRAAGTSISAPEGLRASIVSTTSRVRPRPRWLALLKEPPMRIHSTVAVGSPVIRLAAFLVILAILTTGGAALVVGASMVPSPEVPRTSEGLIAYDSDGDIWVVDGDGTDPRILVGGAEQDVGPVWSPDGSKIAFWRTPPGGIAPSVAVAQADGTLVGTFAPSAGFPLAGYKDGWPNLDWRAGGEEILVRSQSYSLYRLHLGDGAFEQVTVGDRTYRLNSFAWAPDGSRIAFVSWDDHPHWEYVFQSSPDGTDATQLVQTPPIGGSLASVRWDPTSRYVIYSRGPDDPTYAGDTAFQGDSDRIDVHTFDTVQGVEATVAEGLFYAPSWSTDGTLVAFGDEDGALWVSPPDGGTPRRLPGSRFSSIAVDWSPDSRRIATVSGSETDPIVWRLTIIDVDGDGQPIDVDSNLVGAPDWRPVP